MRSAQTAALANKITPGLFRQRFQEMQKLLKSHKADELVMHRIDELIGEYSTMEKKNFDLDKAVSQFDEMFKICVALQPPQPLSAPTRKFIRCVRRPAR